MSDATWLGVTSSTPGPGDREGAGAHNTATQRPSLTILMFSIPYHNPLIGHIFGSYKEPSMSLCCFMIIIRLPDNFEGSSWIEEIFYSYFQYFLQRLFGTGSSLNSNIWAPNWVTEKKWYVSERSALALSESLPTFFISTILKGVMAV